MSEHEELKVVSETDELVESLAVQSVARPLAVEADILDQNTEVLTSPSDAMSEENARRMAADLQTLSESYPELLGSKSEDIGRDKLTYEEQQMVIKYRPFVAYVAGRVLAGLPRHFEEEDLVGYGIIGLIDAIRRFDESRGLRFETYAIPRIKGEIIDNLRAIDWVPRSVRTAARDIEHATGELEFRYGRSPTAPELAKELGVTMKRLRVMQTRASRIGQTSLNIAAPDTKGGDRTTLGELQADKASIGPLEQIELEELNKFLQGALKSLTGQERYVIESHEFKGMDLTAIGKNLGVTESRACQIHTKALAKMRSKLYHEYGAVG